MEDDHMAKEREEERERDEPPEAPRGAPPLDLGGDAEAEREAAAEGRAWDPGPAGDQTWESGVGGPAERRGPPPETDEE